jgi:hypothetical protein
LNTIEYVNCESSSLFFDHPSVERLSRLCYCYRATVIRSDRISFVQQRQCKIITSSTFNRASPTQQNKGQFETPAPLLPNFETMCVSNKKLIERRILYKTERIGYFLVVVSRVAGKNSFESLFVAPCRSQLLSKLPCQRWSRLLVFRFWLPEIFFPLL